MHCSRKAVTQQIAARRQPAEQRHDMPSAAVPCSSQAHVCSTETAKPKSGSTRCLLTVWLLYACLAHPINDCLAG